MTDDQEKRLLEDTIKEGIRFAPEASPPEGFAFRVMVDLKPKRPSLWARLYLWWIQPRVMTFRPVYVVPVVTCAVALLALAFIRTEKPISQPSVTMTTVRFVLNDEMRHASNVAVIGSFNDWKAERSSMWYDENTEAWVLEAQLPPGDHEYLFLVNGDKLVTDPKAQMTRDDGFGNRNAIMFVNGDNGHQAL